MCNICRIIQITAVIKYTLLFYYKLYNFYTVIEINVAHMKTLKSHIQDTVHVQEPKASVHKEVATTSLTL